MILYLDTSAYLRLYIDEPGQDRVSVAVQAADAMVSHLIAYAEMCAALAKLVRTKRLRTGEAASIQEAFERDWQGTNQVMPTDAMVRRAGALATRFALRGYDSLHLAAAESLLLVPQRSPVCFASCDERLNLAAAELGMRRLA